MTSKKVRNGPPGSLGHLPPDRPDPRIVNPKWSNDLEGEAFDLAEPIDDDDYVDDKVEVDDEYWETNYSDDFEDEDEEESKEKYDNDERSPAVELRTIPLEDGILLLVPENDPETSYDACKIEILSAQRRTKLLSELTNIGDILISDAYEVTDRDSIITGGSSISKLSFPVDLPTTRLKNDDLFRFHVMARGTTGHWRKIPADHQNSALTFPLKDVKVFIAYAQPIPEFSNVTSAGFTFKSAKDKQISLEIPEGTTEVEVRMTVKVRPVMMDRMDAYRAVEPRANDGIYALTDVMYVRHTMDTGVPFEGFVRLPLDTVEGDHEIKCLTKLSGNLTKPSGNLTKPSGNLPKPSGNLTQTSGNLTQTSGNLTQTSGNYELVDIDKDQAVKNGQVAIPYTGSPSQTSFQVVCVRPGANKDNIRRDAAYLTGQVDLCSVLFFLSSKKDDRYLTVVFVDKKLEESVYRDRHDRCFYEIRNSRLSGVEVKEKRRIRVDLGGNIKSAELTKNTRFSFVYNSGCRNNSIQFKIAKNPIAHYSLVKVLIDRRIIHEIHFDYPDVGLSLEDITNRYRPTDQGTHTTTSAAKSHKKTEPEQELKPESEPKQEPELKPEPEPKQVPGSKSNPDPEQEPVSKLELKAEIGSESIPSPNADLLAEASQQSRLNSSTDPVTLDRNLKDQRPISACTDASSVPERDHPLLQNKSLVTIGEILSPEEISELMLRADFKKREIDEIRRVAKESAYKPNTQLMFAWKRRTKLEMEQSDNETLKSLEKELIEIGRIDIANILKRLRERKKLRGLKQKDFSDL